MTATMIGRSLSSVGVTFGVLLIAIFVFLVAGANQSLGPFDLDTADRLAVAMCVAAPIAGGLVARGAATSALICAALWVGIPVGLVVALLPLAGTGEYSCWLDLPAVPMGFLLGRLVVGGLTGLGMVTGFVAAGIATRRLLTAVPGIVLAAAATFGASAAAYWLFYGGVRCLQ